MSYVLLVNVLVSQLNKSVWTSKHIKLQQVKLHIKLLLKLLLLLLLLLLIVVQVFCFERVVAYEAPQISTLMIFIHAYQRTALHFLSDFIFYSFYVGGISIAKSNLWLSMPTLCYIHVYHIPCFNNVILLNCFLDIIEKLLEICKILFRFR